MKQISEKAKDIRKVLNQKRKDGSNDSVEDRLFRLELAVCSIRGLLIGFLFTYFICELFKAFQG